MTITPEQILATAKLAKIDPSKMDLDEVSSRISGILDLIDEMQAVNTENVVPMANPHDAKQILRADEIDHSLDKEAQRERLMKNAPSSEEGLFLVPKVIE